MEPQLQQTQGVRLAIEGCGHGTLHAIYASVEESCRRKNWPDVDLLIIGGDFQAVRNAYDLKCVNMPAKYREMADFHEYYSGQRKAPYLTIFVGGNHEASNYLFELYYGGWVAPNIYYMGAANVIQLGPLRVAGLSGIWKGYDYRKPHFERLPYNESDVRSIYHVRELDTRKLLQVRSQVDIGISHDWPRGMEWKGNWKQLFNFKRHLEEDARKGDLGNVAAQQVLDWLRPKLWFSAHLHCKYAAVVHHEGENGLEKAAPPLLVNGHASKNRDEIDLEDDVDGEAAASAQAAPKNADEIDLDIDEPADAPAVPLLANGTTLTNQDEIDLDLDDDVAVQDIQSGKPDATQIEAQPSLQEARAALPESFRRPAPRESVPRPPEIDNKITQFLALDKCLPGKHFLQLMDVACEGEMGVQRPLKLRYDEEWLAITRTFGLNGPLPLGESGAASRSAPSAADHAESIQGQLKWVTENLDKDLSIPDNFEIIAPVYDGGNWNLPQYSQVREYPNPQTAQFCQMLQIPNPFAISDEEIDRRLAAGPKEDTQHMNGGRGRGGPSRGRYRGGGRNRGGRGRFHR